MELSKANRAKFIVGRDEVELLMDLVSSHLTEIEPHFCIHYLIGILGFQITFFS